jgi:hypothetical protein
MNPDDNDKASHRVNIGQRCGLFAALKRQGPAKVTKALVLNVVLSIALFIPVFAFLGARADERVVLTSDKLPWLKFYDDPATSMVISWETGTSANSYIEYGTSLALGSLATNATKVGIHHVSIAGLQPNTIYYYRVGNNDSGIPVVGSTHAFTTAPAIATVPFTFLAISDTQESVLGLGHHALVAEGLAREAAAGARFVLHGGDYADNGGSQDSWNYYFKHAGAYSPNLPIMTAIGNHDDWPGQPLYRPYFAFRSPGESLYYSFNYSIVHVLVLDIAHGAASEFTPAMKTFMQSDLNASAGMPFKIVLFHCPAISSGFFGINKVVMDNMRPLFAQYNVTLCITGHDHHYERLVVDGTTHLVTGGGGGELDPCHEVLAETQAVASVPHYVRFSVNPATGMTLEAIMPDGVVFDAAFFPAA